MLDQEFCAFLEYEITKALGSSKDEQLKGFWCDGVLLPGAMNEYSKMAVSDKQQVMMTAFVGQTGQDKYELTLRFGRKALSRYAKNLSLKPCVPSPEDNNWLYIDPTNKEIVVQLC